MYLSYNIYNWTFPKYLDGTNNNLTCLGRTIGKGLWIDNGTDTQTQIGVDIGSYDDWQDLIITYRDYDIYPYNSASDNFTLQDHKNSFRSQLEG